MDGLDSPPRQSMATANWVVAIAAVATTHLHQLQEVVTALQEPTRL